MRATAREKLPESFNDNKKKTKRLCHVVLMLMFYEGTARISRHKGVDC